MSDLVTISTHVLDTALGTPAGGIVVTLCRLDGSGEAPTIARHVTDADGRVSGLVPHEAALAPGEYRLCFQVAAYFAATQRATFYSEILVNFIVTGGARHYHVPLLLSPFGYSTYRGS